MMIELIDCLANRHCNKQHRTIDKIVANEKYLPIIYHYHHYNYNRNSPISILNLFNRKSNLINSKSTKSNAKFNWKSFYFLIYLIVIYLNRVNCVSILNSSFSVKNFSNSTIHLKSTNQRIFKRSDQTQSTYQILNSHIIDQSFNKISSNWPPYSTTTANEHHLKSSNINKSTIDLLNSKTENSSSINHHWINRKSNFADYDKSLDKNLQSENSTNNSSSTSFDNHDRFLFKLNLDKTLNRSFDQPLKSLSSSSIDNQLNVSKSINLESNETKIKRRFVDNNEQKTSKQDNNLTNNSSDFKIFQKKKDKMQQMDNLKQVFDKLKALLPANSSTPVSRQQKSIMQKQFSENGFQSTNISPDNFNSNPLPANEFDSIPFDQQYRLINKKRFCELCFCAALETGVLKCAKNNHFKFIPILPSADRARITEIHFENQEGIVELNEETFKPYPNISKLTIQNCGLKEIKDRTFKSTPRLKDINLKHNQIKVLLRRHFDDLPLRELIINENPLVCDCPSKWIQNWINKTDYSEKLGADAQNITCNFANKTQLLIETVIKQCEIPIVTFDKPFIEVHEGQNFTIQCIVTGYPGSNLSWNTTGLKSNFNTTLKIFEKQNKKIKTLEVFNANGFDNGYFACNADNTVAKVTKTINVTINAAPKFEFFEQEQKYESYCLKYRITGHPLPTRTWYFNNTLLDFKKHNINDGKYVKTTNVTNNKRNKDFAFDGCLNVKTKSYYLSGIYTLKIKNKYGEVNRTIEAKFLDTYPEQKVPSDIDIKQEDTGQSSSNLNSFHTNFGFIATSSLAVILMILVLVAVFWFLCNYYSKKRSNYKDNKVVAQEKMTLNLSRLVENPIYLEEKQQFLEIKGINHIERNCIELDRPLGEGAFGRVFLGNLVTGSNSNGEVTKISVAVKVLKHMAERLSFEFVREAEMLSGLSHDNIVKFYGISVDKKPIMMIFEFMKLGDLNSFLRSYDLQPDGSIVRKRSINLSFPSFANQPKNSMENTHNTYIDEPKNFENDIKIRTTVTNETYKLQDQTDDDDDSKECDKLLAKNGSNKTSILDKQTMKSEIKALDNQSISDELMNEKLKYLHINDLFSISIQICNGMKYLAEQHFIHRDLATRNCLVTDGIIVKIGDFGMSRDVYTSDYYKVGRQTVLPVRWMPPESLMYRKFTIESDVWSFGIVLWEIWSLGKQPFFELSNIEVIQQVIDGKKLDKPKHCPDDVFALMNKCWKYNALDRSSMAELFIQLQNLSRKSFNEKMKLESD